MNRTASTIHELEQDPLVQEALRMFQGRLVTPTDPTSRSTSGARSSDTTSSRPSSPTTMSAGTTASREFAAEVLDEFINLKP